MMPSSNAGLLSVVGKLLLLPEDAPGITATQRAAWTAFYKTIPPVPTAGTGADATLIAGQKLPPTTSNSENPEMYNVHPYRIFSAAKEGVDTTAAKNAFSKVRFKSNSGWCQLPADAAILGLGSLNDPMGAPQLVAERAAVGPAAGYRYVQALSTHSATIPPLNHSTIPPFHHSIILPHQHSSQRLSSCSLLVRSLCAC